MNRTRASILTFFGWAFALAISQQAQAATVNWATWSYPQTTGLTTGAASGSTSDVNVTYSGNVQFSTQVGGFVWLPTTTFQGGTVADAPTNNTEVTLTGGPGTGTSSITFSQAVTDPVLAIASLGSPGVMAAFDFNLTGSQSLAIEAGGPSSNFGGSTIVLCTAGSNNICGDEGSGVVQFFGTFTTLSWANPLYEDYYLLTVGDEGLAPVGTTPLPAALPLFASGLGALGLFGWRRKRKNASAIATT